METKDAKTEGRGDWDNLKYHAGFGNHFESEAMEGAVPKNISSPQKCPYGLYNEQITGTAFTAPRHDNQWVFVYRIKPSVVHMPYKRIDPKTNYSKIKNDFFNPENIEVNPTQMRWRPLSEPKGKKLNWVESLVTMGGAGDPTLKQGMAIYLYACNASMENKSFYSSDGEFLIVPQQGTLYITTELGKLKVDPIEIAVIPRGIKFSIDVDGFSRGYATEVFKSHFKLPELGPMGQNALANARDFQIPTAWYEDVKQNHTVINKYAGKFFEYGMDHSPFNVVGWHGNFYPYKYNLKHFNTMGSVSYDHAVPSILTVLTCPTDEIGTAVCDFVVFPPRWEVQENTFKLPWFHRNCMSEFNGYIWKKDYKETEGGFYPGTSSLHVQMTSHGPDAEGYEIFRNEAPGPSKIEDSYAFMFETSYLIQTTKFAFEDNLLVEDAYKRWIDMKDHFAEETKKGVESDKAQK